MPMHSKMPAPNSVVELLRDAEARGFAEQTRHGDLVIPANAAHTTSPPIALLKTTPTNSPLTGGEVMSSRKSVPDTGGFSNSTASTKPSAKRNRNASASPVVSKRMAPSNSLLPPDLFPS